MEQLMVAEGRCGPTMSPFSLVPEQGSRLGSDGGDVGGGGEGGAAGGSRCRRTAQQAQASSSDGSRRPVIGQPHWTGTAGSTTPATGNLSA